MFNFPGFWSWQNAKAQIRSSNHWDAILQRCSQHVRFAVEPQASHSNNSCSNCISHLGMDLCLAARPFICWNDGHRLLMLNAFSIFRYLCFQPRAQRERVPCWAGEEMCNIQLRSCRASIVQEISDPSPQENLALTPAKQNVHGVCTQELFIFCLH